MNQSDQGGATITTHQRYDALDGQPLPEGEETVVTFSYDAVHYELCLSKQNAELFHRTIARYLRSARRVEPPDPRTRAGAPSPGPGRSQTSVNMPAIRRWARETGFDIKDTGRLHQIIIDAYLRNERTAMERQQVAHDS